MNPTIIPVSGYTHICIIMKYNEDDDSSALFTTPIIAFHYTFEHHKQYNEIIDSQCINPISAFHGYASEISDAYYFVQDPNGLIFGEQQYEGRMFDNIEELKAEFKL